MDCSYDDDPFEEDNDVQKPVAVGSERVSVSPSSLVERGNWTNINFDEIEVNEQIGGGSVGVVHRGSYMGKSVALKTLVSSRILLVCCSSVREEVLQYCQQYTHSATINYSSYTRSRWSTVNWDSYPFKWTSIETNEQRRISDLCWYSVLVG